MAILEDGDVRLRPADLKEDMSFFLEWYTNPDVLFIRKGQRQCHTGPT